MGPCEQTLHVTFRPGEQIWYPELTEGGDLSWRKSVTDTPPEPHNIRGPSGSADMEPITNMELEDLLK